MAAHLAPLDEETRRTRRYFLLKRLHSLSGIVPVGLFLVVHLWTNSKAVQGRTCFNSAVESIGHLPFLPVIEVFGILLPIAFHALYGVKLALMSKQNVGQYGYARNWMFFLQRITGLITLVFIVFHLKDFYIAKVFHLDGITDKTFFNDLSRMLSNAPGRVPWKALFYVLGVTASVFHFANGIRTFLFALGLTISERSQRYAAWATAAFGVVLWFLGTNTVLFFAAAPYVPSTIVKGEGRDMCEETVAPAPVEPKAMAAPGAPQPAIPR